MSQCEQMNEIKKQQVFEVLITPIICNKRYEKIERKYGVILSPQKYKGSADEDMSDFAIEFYKILYKDFLMKNIPDEKGELIDEDGYLKNKEIAGDTMNSFNTIANMNTNNCFIYTGMDISLSLDPFTTYYQLQYHCLANFWLIPMRHGRMPNKKMRPHDSMDIYIYNLMHCWENFKKEETISYRNDENKYKNYFLCFKTIEEFKTLHYVGEIESEEEIAKIEKMYLDKNGKELMEKCLCKIFQRARKIANDSEIAFKLYNAFKEKGLLIESSQ